MAAAVVVAHLALNTQNTYAGGSGGAGGGDGGAGGGVGTGSMGGTGGALNAAGNQHWKSVLVLVVKQLVLVWGLLVDDVQAAVEAVEGRILPGNTTMLTAFIMQVVIWLMLAQTVALVVTQVKLVAGWGAAVVKATENFSSASHQCQGGAGGANY